MWVLSFAIFLLCIKVMLDVLIYNYLILANITFYRDIVKLPYFTMFF